MSGIGSFQQTNGQAFVEAFTPALIQYVFTPLSEAFAQRGFNCSPQDMAAILKMPATKPSAGIFGAGTPLSDGVQEPPKKPGASKALDAPIAGRCDYPMTRGTAKGKYCGAKATHGEKCWTHCDENKAKKAREKEEKERAKKDEGSLTGTGLSVGGSISALSGGFNSQKFPGIQFGASSGSQSSSLFPHLGSSLGVRGLSSSLSSDLGQAPQGLTGLTQSVPVATSAAEPLPPPQAMNVAAFDGYHVMLLDLPFVIDPENSSVVGKKVTSSTSVNDLAKLSEEEAKVARTRGLTVPETVIVSATPVLGTALGGALGSGRSIPAPNPTFQPTPQMVPISNLTPVAAIPLIPQSVAPQIPV